jgi:sulfoxide reductase catalytic subunit YedY
MTKKSFNTSAIKESDITSEKVFWKRREFIKNFSAAAGYMGMMGILPACAEQEFSKSKQSKSQQPVNPQASSMTLSGDSLSGDFLKKQLSSEYVITHHNNFYEFSTDKKKPAEMAKNFNPGNDWKVSIGGEVEKPGDYTLEDILKFTQVEERIYRFRCVEAWSMVIPWNGFQLSQLINQVKPNSKAKFIEFKTLHDEKQFPGQKRGRLGLYTLPWPYTEALTMAEAMHPLTFMATGVYGKRLPGQSGAPLRLVVPWKYGFKSIKSIVSIRFTEKQPVCTWNKSAPSEYGFYANVNPKVDHPRWSQASERLITDDSLFGVKRIPTQLFNGYGEQVEQLYRGIDLSKNF